MLSINSFIRYVPNSLIKNSKDVKFSDIKINKLVNCHLPSVKPNKIYNTSIYV